MPAYTLSFDSDSKLIESKLRESGSSLITESWTCWVQFYYQQLESTTTSIRNRDVPLFTAIGIESREFVLSESPESLYVSDELDSVPSHVIDITEIDSRLFEKINVFNLIKKSVKKIKYVFKHFRWNNVNVLISDEIVILDGPAPTIVPSSHKSLGVNAGFVRPKWASLDETSKVAFWIYQLAKQTERVFPTEAPPKEIEFIDCLVAKDFLLV